MARPEVRPVAAYKAIPVAKAVKARMEDAQVASSQDLVARAQAVLGLAEVAAEAWEVKVAEVVNAVAAGVRVEVKAPEDLG